ncbi:MAG: hypothetical protein Q8R15_01555 [Candidatus Micrarchaeota archaeon]|nr:hypothetical protein [Candidatus Micrarchaeota archaeon]
MVVFEHTTFIGTTELRREKKDVGRSPLTIGRGEDSHVKIHRVLLNAFAGHLKSDRRVDTDAVADRIGEVSRQHGEVIFDAKSGNCIYVHKGGHPLTAVVGNDETLLSKGQSIAFSPERGIRLILHGRDLDHKSINHILVQVKKVG